MFITTMRKLRKFSDRVFTILNVSVRVYLQYCSKSSLGVLKPNTYDVDEVNIGNIS